MKRSLILAILATAPTISAQSNPSHSPVIRTEVNLVTVPVTVMSIQGRLVSGLDAQNFEVYEDGVQQEILHCSTDDAPVSIVIVFDNSGSMAAKSSNMRDGGKTGIAKANISRTAVREFVHASNPEDEFSLVTFGDEARLIADWTSESGISEAVLTTPPPQGETALMDALFIGINQMRTARYQRRVILLVTDGGDNHSRYSENDIKRALKEKEIQFYSIGIFDNPDITNLRNFRTFEEMMGPTLLSELSNMTGGLAFKIVPDREGRFDEHHLTDLAAHVGRAIRDEYVLDYKPANGKAHDGKHHNLKVKLVHIPRSLPPLIPYARYGYTAGK